MGFPVVSSREWLGYAARCRLLSLMGTPTFSEIELALTSTALAGDAGGLYRIASGLMDQGIPFDSLLFDYLIPTERAVGQRWQQGDYLVAEEHAATATIETVISLLAGMLDQPSDGVSVVIATAEGDHHSLPAKAAAAHLLFLGYRTTFLGANVPGADFKEFLEVEPPTAVVLSCAMSSHLLGARSVIAAAHAVGVPVLVGGNAFGVDGRWAATVGADAWVGLLEDVVSGLEAWQLSDRVDLAEGVEFPPELAELRASRTAVLADAEGALPSGVDGAIDARLKDEVGTLLSAVEAAMLVDDDDVLVDMLTWQASTLRAYGYSSNAAASPLRDALGVLSNSGAERLTSAGRSVGIFED